MTKTIKTLVPATDVVLMGAGIMSATLGMILKELDPNLTIQVFERLEEPGLESSDAWNNAGTGHSAFCELNYTPQNAEGIVNISKALKIAEAFEMSKEFWSYLIEQEHLTDPKRFISALPHMSFVWGAANVDFLKARFLTMKSDPFFQEMKWTDDPGQIAQWTPLIMDGRTKDQPVSATRIEKGTDINFGELTRALFQQLDRMPGVTVHYNVEALDLDPDGRGGWDVKIKNLLSDEKGKVNSKFVFIGAGGATLHLLKRAEIEERDGYGGFPVSGLWLKCLNETFIEQHQAKVYGKASVGAPPMSVPHLDTRMIEGRRHLMFGPFAGFSTKFMKNGSLMDLPKSIKFDNAIPMIFAGMKNMPLTQYLIQQLRLTPEDRLASLQEYVPTARLSDWELKEAGQRVQVIKKDKEKGGVLEFGTELVISKDGTVAALLGASPGASTAATVMMDLVSKCFPEKMKTAAWQEKLKAMIPSYGTHLSNDEKQLHETRSRTQKILQLE